jgi:Uma2 family endonuclease
MPAEPLVLPSVLNDSLRLSPEQFTQLCQANPEAVLELQADGSILAMPPPVVTRGP